MRRVGTYQTLRVSYTDWSRVEAILDRHSPIDTSTGAADQAGDRSGNRIVAAFENADRARAARKALTEAGIDNAKMELLDNRRELDNWTAVKRHAVPDEDAHLYAEGLGRGHSILVVRVTAGEHD